MEAKISQLLLDNNFELFENKLIDSGKDYSELYQQNFWDNQEEWMDSLITTWLAEPLFGNIYLGISKANSKSFISNIKVLNEKQLSSFKKALLQVMGDALVEWQQQFENTVDSEDNTNQEDLGNAEDWFFGEEDSPISDFHEVVPGIDYLVNPEKNAIIEKIKITNDEDGDMAFFNILNFDTIVDDKIVVTVREYDIRDGDEFTSARYIFDFTNNIWTVDNDFNDATERYLDYQGTSDKITDLTKDSILVDMLIHLFGCTQFETIASQQKVYVTAYVEDENLSVGFKSDKPFTITSEEADYDGETYFLYRDVPLNDSLMHVDESLDINLHVKPIKNGWTFVDYTLDDSETITFEVDEQYRDEEEFTQPNFAEYISGEGAGKIDDFHNISPNTNYVVSVDNEEIVEFVKITGNEDDDMAFAMVFNFDTVIDDVLIFNLREVDVRDGEDFTDTKFTFEFADNTWSVSNDFNDVADRLLNVFGNPTNKISDLDKDSILLNTLINLFGCTQFDNEIKTNQIVFVNAYVEDNELSIGFSSEKEFSVEGEEADTDGETYFLYKNLKPGESFIYVDEKYNIDISVEATKTGWGFIDNTTSEGKRPIDLNKNQESSIIDSLLNTAKSIIGWDSKTLTPETMNLFVDETIDLDSAELLNKIRPHYHLLQKIQEDKDSGLTDIETAQLLFEDWLNNNNTNPEINSIIYPAGETDDLDRLINVFMKAVVFFPEFIWSISRQRYEGEFDGLTKLISDANDKTELTNADNLIKGLSILANKFLQVNPNAEEYDFAVVGRSYDTYFKALTKNMNDNIDNIYDLVGYLDAYLNGDESNLLNIFDENAILWLCNVSIAYGLDTNIRFVKKIIELKNSTNQNEIVHYNNLRKGWEHYLEFNGLGEILPETLLVQLENTNDINTIFPKQENLNDLKILVEKKTILPNHDVQYWEEEDNISGNYDTIINQGFCFDTRNFKYYVVDKNGKLLSEEQNDERIKFAKYLKSIDKNGVFLDEESYDETGTICTFDILIGSLTKNLLDGVSSNDYSSETRYYIQKYGNEYSNNGEMSPDSNMGYVYYYERLPNDKLQIFVCNPKPFYNENSKKISMYNSAYSEEWGYENYFVIYTLSPHDYMEFVENDGRVALTVVPGDNGWTINQTDSGDVFHWDYTE